MTLEDAIAQMEDIAGLDISMADVWRDLLLFWGGIVGSLLLMMLIGWGIWKWLNRKYGPAGWQQAGIKQIEALKASSVAPKDALSMLNQILKRCACAAGYRHEVARLSGAEWVGWLRTHVKAHYVHHHDVEVLDMLGTHEYAPDHSVTEAVPPMLFEMAEKAIMSMRAESTAKET